MLVLGFSCLSALAIPPTRATLESAGWDLYSSEDSRVPAKGRKLVHTGLRLTLPEGTYGRIAPRSGLAIHHGINVGAGVVDRDYTGEVCIVLFNHDDNDYNVTAGDKIAQLIVEQYKICTIQEIVLNEDGRPKRKQARMSSSTVRRGPLGFGSTGK